MDRWELYTAGKIPKPTNSPQLLRMEAHGDFVIEAGIQPTPVNSAPDVSAKTFATTTIPVKDPTTEDVTDVPCFEPASADLAADPSKDSDNRTGCRRKRLWKETCDPGNLPISSLQMAACGFILVVASTLLVLLLITRTY